MQKNLDPTAIMLIIIHVEVYTLDDLYIEAYIRDDLSLLTQVDFSHHF